MLHHCRSIHIHIPSSYLDPPQGRASPLSGGTEYMAPPGDRGHLDGGGIVEGVTALRHVAASLRDILSQSLLGNAINLEHITSYIEDRQIPLLEQILRLVFVYALDPLSTVSLDAFLEFFIKVCGYLPQSMRVHVPIPGTFVPGVLETVARSPGAKTETVFPPFVTVTITELFHGFPEGLPLFHERSFP